MRDVAVNEYAKAREVERETEAPKANIRLTTRDEELLAHVATARYLTLPQLKKIVFVRSSRENGQAGRSGKAGPSDAVCKRRLARLCLADAPYLRRLRYQDGEAATVAVYAAAPAGQVVALEVLGRTPPHHSQDLKPQFLAHTVALNDLYVALAAACVGQHLPPRRYPFVWLSTETGGLPWRERNARTGQIEGRRLVPDAVLELPAEPARVFLECEMGGHHLVRKDESAPGSVLGKLNRYATFMLNGIHQTFYEQRYTDRWPAELAFLMHLEKRAANVSALIARWREQNRAVPLSIKAFSFSEAAMHYCARLRIPSPAEQPATIERAELRLVCSFVSQVATTYKAVRQYPARESHDPRARVPVSGVHGRVSADGRVRRALRDGVQEQSMNAGLELDVKRHVGG